MQQIYQEITRNRVQFWRWLDGQAQLMNCILLTDEIQVHRDGYRQYMKLHFRSHDIPHEVMQSSLQQGFVVNVWCGMVDSHCGPHVIKGHTTTASYRHFLRTDYGFI